MNDLAGKLLKYGMGIHQYAQQISDAHPKTVMWIAIAGMFVCLLIISNVFGPEKESTSHDDAMDE